MLKDSRKGVNCRKCPTNKCMVVDCQRLALFKTHKVVTRGYCRVHKAYAHGSYSDRKTDSVANYILGQAGEL